MADIKRRTLNPDLPAAGAIDVGQEFSVGLTWNLGQHGFSGKPHKDEEE
jgi:hypothetical protein